MNCYRQNIPPANRQMLPDRAEVSSARVSKQRNNCRSQQDLRSGRPMLPLGNSVRHGVCNFRGDAPPGR